MNSVVAVFTSQANHVAALDRGSAAHSVECGPFIKWGFTWKGRALACLVVPRNQRNFSAHGPSMGDGASHVDSGPGPRSSNLTGPLQPGLRCQAATVLVWRGVRRREREGEMKGDQRLSRRVSAPKRELEW